MYIYSLSFKQPRQDSMAFQAHRHSEALVRGTAGHVHKSHLSCCPWVTFPGDGKHAVFCSRSQPWLLGLHTHTRTHMVPSQPLPLVCHHYHTVPRFKSQEKSFLLSSPTLSPVFCLVHNYLLSMKTHKIILQDTTVSLALLSWSLYICARKGMFYKEKAQMKGQVLGL